MKMLSLLITAIVFLAAFDNATAQTASASSGTVKSNTNAAAKAPAGSNTEQELMKITYELNDADNRGDKKVFDKYFADGYFSTDMDGRTFTKAQILENLRPTPASYHSTIDFEDIQVRDYGNTALLSLKFNDHSERNGQKLTRSYRATDIFMKQDGQ
jgi:ketosteroid isomerase-like protein